MSSATIEETQCNLAKMIHRLVPGEQLIITENGNPVATLVATAYAPVVTGKRIPGLWKDKATILVEDDEHLKEFEDEVS